MSDKIKGSDGIERSIDEWRLFIEERILHINDDGRLDEEMTKAKWETRYFFQCKEQHRELGIEAGFEGIDADFPDLKSFIGDAAFEFFRLALEDASRGSSEDSKMEILSSHMRSFADKLTSKMDQRVHDVGRAILRFIDKHDRLPDQPKELESFTEESPDMDRLPRKTISAWLAEYRLEKFIKGNKRKH